MRNPTCHLVDQGTRFGAVVGRSGGTELHVLEGRVALSTDEPAVFREVEEGQAVVFEGKQLQEMPADARRFLSAAKLRQRASAEDVERIAAWQRASKVFRDDPSLVAWYTFEPDSATDRTLQNCAPLAAPGTDGTLVGCQWSEGRWRGKGALEFNRLTDRVCFHLPWEFPALTLMAWISINSLPNNFNSLLLSDGFDPGNVHWEITGDGRLMCGFARVPFTVTEELGRLHQGVYYRTQPVFRPTQLSRWVHVALVCDSQSQTATHWLNRQKLGNGTTSPLRLEVPIQLGTAEIENWHARERAKYPIRNFHGRIDELLVFSRGLSAEEINHHFMSGKPDAPLDREDEAPKDL